jgi:AraC-like DNA-binding protein
MALQAERGNLVGFLKNLVFSFEALAEQKQITLQFLQRALAGVAAHLEDEQFGLEQLAEEVHMSVSQLNRKLKALIDQPADQLIRSMRMQRAADLLKQNAGTVAEIAYRMGFDSQAHFTTMFQKQFGCTPSEHKKRQ